MEGGVRWKEGADTCVFKPSVACKEDPVKFFGNIPNYISRIVTKNSRDIEIETVLNLKYKHLMRLGFVSAFAKRCTPEFSERNLSFTTMKLQPQVGGPCLTLSSRELENLITKEYNISLKNYIIAHYPIPINTLLTALRGAICAAIELVPDNGIWVIHMDLHFDNILIRFGKNGEILSTALADWGRAITFDSTNPLSIFFALHWYLQWAKGMHYNEKNRNKATFQKLGKNFELAGTFQSSTTMFTAIDALFYDLGNITGLSLRPDRFQMMPDGRVLKDSENDILNPSSVDGLKTLRGFMVYVIIKQLFIALHMPVPRWLSEILFTKNQAELINVVNKYIKNPGGFYNKAFVTPVVLSATTQATSSLGAGATTTTTTTTTTKAATESKEGGRRKKTRKHKRKSKKTRRI